MNKILILLIITSTITQAKVTAKVDRNQIVIGESFNLTITVDENSSQQPDLSELSEVFKVIGTSQSSSTQIINGKYSIEKSWQVSLMPKSLGRNAIPPIKLGSQTTKPIQINVSKSDPSATANGDLFIEATPDKTQAFVKEQIIITVKLFYSISLSEGNLSEPNAPNSIVTQLDKGTTYTTNRNGKNYTVVERHYALFAEKSGTLEINPIIFNGRDNSSRRSFSMFSTGKPIRAVSKPLSFDIKPIPQTSIGKDWLPATSIRLSQEWTKGPYKVGEPITRTITLYAEGLNDTQIPEIDLGEIKDVRVYPEQPQTQNELTAQSIKAWKQVKIALIPTHAGAIRIPEYSLEWFNTKTQKIQQAKLPPFTLQVEAGEFAIQKPEIAQLKSKEKVQKTTGKPVDSTKSEIKIIGKSNPFFKWLSALLAALWIATLYYFLTAKKHKAQKKLFKIETISKKLIIDSIRNNDYQQLQKNLIDWWNQQYPEKTVTNLSQIKPYVHQPMQQLIEVLELHLYNPKGTTRFNQDLWLKQINSKGLDLISSSKNNNETGLPKLY